MIKIKKAQILSMDAMIGVFLVGIILLGIFVSTSRISTEENIRTPKIGYDIVSILDYEGTLATLDESLIQSRIDSLLPNQYSMQLRLAGNFGAIEVGDQQIQRFVASGKRIFVNSTNQDYGVATFWIWLK